MKYIDKTFRWDTEYLINEWVNVLYYSKPRQRVLVCYNRGFKNRLGYSVVVIDKLQKPFKIIEEDTEELAILKSFIIAKKIGWDISKAKLSMGEYEDEK